MPDGAWSPDNTKPIEMGLIMRRACFCPTVTTIHTCYESNLALVSVCKLHLTRLSMEVYGDYHVSNTSFRRLIDKQAVE